jgi:hypothetical protein
MPQQRISSWTSLGVGSRRWMVVRAKREVALATD